MKEESTRMFSIVREKILKEGGLEKIGGSRRIRNATKFTLAQGISKECFTLKEVLLFMIT